MSLSLMDRSGRGNDDVPILFSRMEPASASLVPGRGVMVQRVSTVAFEGIEARASG